MAIDRDGLKRSYSAKSDDELLDLHALGTLTELAYDVLESELSARGLPIPKRGKDERPIPQRVWNTRQRDEADDGENTSTEWLSKHRDKLSIVYGCHAFLGAVVGLFTIANLVDPNTGLMLAWLIGIPLFIPMIVAALTALVLTIWLWRHWPLVLLMILAAVPLFLPEPLWEAADLMLLVYASQALLFAGWWFFLTRPSLRHLKRE